MRAAMRSRRAAPSMNCRCSSAFCACASTGTGGAKPVHVDEAGDEVAPDLAAAAAMMQNLLAG
jgi:hypothetical protein